LPTNLKVVKLIEDAKKVFYKGPNVIDVGVGERRTENESHRDEIVLIAYVKEKLPADAVEKHCLISTAFAGIATDVLAQFWPDALERTYAPLLSKGGGSCCTILSVSQQLRQPDNFVVVQMTRKDEKP